VSSVGGVDWKAVRRAPDYLPDVAIMPEAVERLQYRQAISRTAADSGASATPLAPVKLRMRGVKRCPCGLPGDGCYSTRNAGCRYTVAYSCGAVSWKGESSQRRGCVAGLRGSAVAVRGKGRSTKTSCSREVPSWEESRCFERGCVGVI
jgi:hypothetical protein